MPSFPAVGRFLNFPTHLLAAALLSLALPVMADTDLPELRTVASDHARFFGYEVQKDGDGLHIRGHLMKNPAYPTSMRGRIRVELLNAEGRVIEDFTADHRHFPSRKKRLRFQVRVPELPTGLERIRLIHLG